MTSAHGELAVGRPGTHDLYGPLSANLAGHRNATPCENPSQS